MKKFLTSNALVTVVLIAGAIILAQIVGPYVVSLFNRAKAKVTA
jgi:hypothetical protein